LVSQIGVPTAAVLVLALAAESAGTGDLERRRRRTVRPAAWLELVALAV
jgi:hypothetical protein